MSSLVPGAIFGSSGFNRKSTPTPPNITPDQLDCRYKRDEYNGHDWPADSPVSRSYDVANTSTKLIILNNKYGQNSTRLRGYYTGPKKPDRSVNPDRHRAKSPRDPRYHEACLDSSSPKFEPTIKTDLDWLGSSQRPPNALIVRSSVNQRRHASCRSSPEMQMHNERPYSRMSLPAKYLYNSEYADMSIGERIYLWSIEKIYNVERMKKLKQDQYQKLLDGEAKKGYLSRGEFAKYRRYINSASDRSYGTGSQSANTRRSKSAYSQRSRSSQGKPSPAKSDTKSDGKETEQTERPKTSMGHARKESRDRSKSPERAERHRSASVESEDRKPISKERKSPASSRKSSARSQRSVRSPTRSKSSTRVSSKASLRSTEITKGNNSDTKGDNTDKKGNNSDTKGDDSDTKEAADNETIHHKEGKDRPKSRLGHPGGADDRDKDSLHSSNLSIKSDNYGSSGDSGLEKQKRENNVTKQLNSSGDNSTDNGTKRKSDSEYNQKKVKGNTRANKSMGSRVSVGSKASKTSDNEKNKTNGHRNNVDNKENVNEKVHRIPSAAYIEDEANDDKGGKERDVMKQKDESNDTKIESKDNVDNSKPSEEQEEKVDSDKEDIEKRGQEKGDDGKDKEKEAVSDNQRKSDSETSDASNESLDNKKGKNEDSEKEKEESSDDNGEKKESDDAIKDEDTDKKEEESKVRNKLSRQDSFDDDDDDRKVNKDLDKIEY